MRVMIIEDFPGELDTAPAALQLSVQLEGLRRGFAKAHGPAAEDGRVVALDELEDALVATYQKHATVLGRQIARLVRQG